MARLGTFAGGFGQGLSQGGQFGLSLVAQRFGQEMAIRESQLQEQRFRQDQMRAQRESLLANFDVAVNDLGRLVSVRGREDPRVQAMATNLGTVAQQLANLGMQGAQTHVGSRIQAALLGNLTATETAQQEGAAALTKAEAGGAEAAALTTTQETLARGRAEETVTQEAFPNELARLQAVAEMEANQRIRVNAANAAAAAASTRRNVTAKPEWMYDPNSGEERQVDFARNPGAVDELLAKGWVFIEQKPTTYLNADNGRLRQVNEGNPFQVNAATNEGFVRTTSSTSLESLLGQGGIDEETVAAAREALRDADRALAQINATMEGFKAEPNSFGLAGGIIEFAGGLGQQLLPGVTQGIADAMGIDFAKVQDTRTRARLVTSGLLEYIINEKGRYTEPDRELAAQTLRLLPPEASAPQIIASANVVAGIIISDQNRAVNDIFHAWQSDTGLDISTTQGFESFWRTLARARGGNMSSTLIGVRAWADRNGIPRLSDDRIRSTFGGGEQ